MATKPRPRKNSAVAPERTTNGIRVFWAIGLRRECTAAAGVVSRTVGWNQ